MPRVCHSGHPWPPVATRGVYFAPPVAFISVHILFTAFVILFFINLKYFKKILDYFFWTNEENSCAFNTFNLGHNVKI